MKGYKFKFEKILNLRIRQEEQEEDRYLLLKKELTEITNKIIALEQEKEKIFQSLRDKESDLTLNISLRKYLKKITNEVKENNIKKVAKKEEVEAQFEILMEKKKERKTMEKLKEKETDKYIKEFLEDEQKELDEIGRHYSIGGRLT
jgi:flagellar FliJ protein